MKRWSDEATERLKVLWAEGLSGQKIANTLSRERLFYGSRNAVIGRADRIGLPARPSPIKGNGTPSRRKRVAETIEDVTPREYADEPEDTTPALSAPVPFVDRSCQWPFGHPNEADFHFCGKSAVPGKPYCAAHMKRAYIQKPQKQDQAETPSDARPGLRAQSVAR